MSTLRQCEWVRFSVGDVRRVECGRRGARGSPARYVYEPTLTLSDPAFSPPARRPDSPTADSPPALVPVPEPLPCLRSVQAQWKQPLVPRLLVTFAYRHSD